MMKKRRETLNFSHDKTATCRKTTFISIIALSVILFGIFSYIISQDNIVTAKKSTSSSSSKSLGVIPSNSTDFPSPDDASAIQPTFLKTSKDI